MQDMGGENEGFANVTRRLFLRVARLTAGLLSRPRACRFRRADGAAAAAQFLDPTRTARGGRSTSRTVLRTVAPLRLAHGAIKGSA